MGANRIYDVGDKVSILIDKREYVSKILRITDEGGLVIYVPSYNGSDLQLIDDKNYSLIFYVNGGLYKADVVLEDIYEEKGIDVVELELMSELERYQRREYFRIDYFCDIEYKILEIYSDDGSLERHNGKWCKAKLSNISGGGMKFNSEEGIPNAKRVFLKFALGEGINRTQYSCLANVVLISKKDIGKLIYEYRVSFSDIDESARENIVKFVFEEERRMRRKKNWG